MDRQIAFLYLVGGNGTRIKTLFPRHPKPLIPLAEENGHAVERDLSRLISFSVRHNPNNGIFPDVFAIGNLDQQAIEKVSDMVAKRLVRANLRDHGYVPYFSTELKRGVPNAVIDAFNQYPQVSDFIVVNGDELRLDNNRTPVDFTGYINSYLDNNCTGSLYVATAKDYNLHRIVQMSKEGLIQSTTLLNESSAQGNSTDAEKVVKKYEGKVIASLPVFAGACIISRSAAPLLNRESTGWSGIINPLVQANRMWSFHDHSVRYYINAGTPAEYECAVEIARPTYVRA